ncbi:MAG: hypothetical protein H0U73_05665, partial [Tatlockia sp.]|nr:hypothetical protein [Tatlockia sp.]
MSNLFEALQTLKTEIEVLRPHAWKRDDTGLDKIQDSQQIFVNPDLLGQIKIPDDKNLISPTESTTYSDNVLQAMWNIADLILAGKGSLVGIDAWILSSVSALLKNFNYLDQDLNAVPKIVDEKTYKSAMALLKFTKEVDKESLSIVSDLISNEILSKFEDMIPLLEKRIAVYEAHTSEQVDKSKTYIRRKEALINQMDEAYTSLIGKQPYELLTKISKGIKLLKSKELLIEHLQEMKKSVNGLQASLEKFKALSTELIIKNEDLPDRLEGSYFLYTLNNFEIKQESVANQNSESVEFNKKIIIDEWQKVFNEGVELLDLEIKEGLSGFINIKTSETSTLNTALKKAKAQINLIEETIALDKVNQATVGERPKSIIDNKGKPEFLIKESTQEDRASALNETIQECKIQIKQLEDYKQLLEEKKTQLDHPEAFQNEFEIPQTVLAEATAIYSAKIDDELPLVTQVLKAAREKKDISESSLAKMSTAGRQQVIKRVDFQVHSTFQKVEAIKTNAVRLNAQRYEFIKHEFEPAIEAINRKFDPQIEKLDSQINARQTVLFEAHKKLDEFKQALSESSGIYLPIDKISQDELLEYLDLHSSSSSAKNIKAIYAEAEAASSWYGLNAGNAFNKISGTIFGSNTKFQYNQRQLLTLIESKLLHISNELITDNENIQNELPENNLIALTNAKNKLINSKEEEMSRFVAKKRNHNQAIKKSQQNLQLEQFKHQLALAVSEAQHLEYKLDGIESLPLSTEFSDEKAKHKFMSSLFDNRGLRDNTVKGLHSNLHSRLIRLGNSLEALTKLPAELTKNQIENFVEKLQSLGKKDDVFAEKIEKSQQNLQLEQFKHQLALAVSEAQHLEYKLDG